MLWPCRVWLAANQEGGACSLGCKEPKQKASVMIRAEPQQAWSYESKQRLMKTNRLRSKRQLGGTGVRWIPPGRPRTTAQTSQTSTQSWSRPASATSVPSKDQSKQSAHSLRSCSVSGLGGLSNLIKLAPRPQSSMGFHTRWGAGSKTPSGGLTPPQGFDLASYVKQNKSAKGIVIGCNGQPTTDVYFDAYLAQCEEELSNKQELTPDTNAVIEQQSTSCESAGMGSQSTVPLCWEDQLCQSEPDSHRVSITPTLPENIPVTQRKQLIDTLKVKLLLNKRCLLNTTPIRFLQSVPDESPMTTSTSSSSVWSSDENRSRHKFEILLYSEGSQVQQELERQSFDVVLSTLSENYTKTHTKLTARRVLKNVSMISVSFEVHTSVFQTETESPSHGLKSLTVRYGQPRSFLFAVNFSSSADGPDQPTCSHENTQFVDQLQTQLDKARERERVPVWGALDIPEKFFYKRMSYCNQEEDEDRTDLEAISSYLPDLMLLDEDIDTPFNTPTTTPRQMYRTKSPQNKILDIPETTFNRQTPSTNNVSDVQRFQEDTKLLPETIIVPSAGDRYHPIPMRYTSSVAVHKRPNNKEHKQPHREEDRKQDTKRTCGAFSTIAISWLDRYVHN